jgi:hypothetical protein
MPTYQQLSGLPNSSLASNTLVPMQDNVSGIYTNKKSRLDALIAAINAGITLPTLSGDVTNSGNAVTLNTVNANVGSFTNPNVTVDGKGRITAISNGTGGSASIISQTHSQLATLILNSTLVPGQMYYDSDKKVILTALSTTQFSSKGIYLYTRGKKSWGAFKITGTTGNVSQITVGSDNLLTATQTYAATNQIARVNPGGTAPNVDISLLTLANAIAANINANGSMNTKYKAYAVANGDVPTALWGVVTGALGIAYVIIEAVSTGVSLNGSSISVTSSGLTIASLTAMQGGVIDLTSPLLYLCTYDFTNDRLLALYDPLYNNEVAYDDKTVVNDLTSYSTYMFDFNWNNPLVVNNKLTNCTITRNFILAGSSNYSGGMAVMSNFLNYSVFGTNLIIAGEISFNNGRYGQISQNIVNNAITGISGNDLVGQIDSNYMAICPSDISCNYMTGGGITNNCLSKGGSIRYCSESGGYGITDGEVGYMTCIWNVSGWNAVKSNQLRSRAQLINLVNPNGVGIFAQNEVNDDSFISDIHFDGSFVYFINNKINNFDTRRTAPSYQHWSEIQFDYNRFEGSIFQSGNNLERVSLIGADSVSMQGITLKGATGSVINIHGAGASGYGRMSFDIHIEGFDGTNIGNIATHSLLSFQSSNTIVTGGYVYATGLTTSGSPTIALGINSTNNAIMAATATSTLNTGDGTHGTGMTSLGNIIANAVTAFVPLTITVANGAITAGKLVIHIDCFRLDQ